VPKAVTGLGKMRSVVVNDVHSRLNATHVADVAAVGSLASLRGAIGDARTLARPVALAGGHHAMGGQQFVAGGTLIDTRPMRRVLAFDRERGQIEVEAGITWPQLIDFLIRAQEGATRQWGIVQKQTGADAFTIGGSVSANCHGRGLALPPIAADVQALRLVLADGSLLRCSREENGELFALVVGGYGLFGAIYSVTLRLAPRRKLERVVELVTIDGLVGRFAQRITDGFLYGDFQFAIDSRSPDFLRRGVFSCYRPVGAATPITAGQRALSRENWQFLLTLAHTDKTRAFEEYARHYLATSGQNYWSDLHQLADYTPGYHAGLDRQLSARHPASEMISELYVPRARLADFMAAAAAYLRRRNADVIYGTIRLIERDEETFLAWAKADYACIIFNLHTVHTDDGIAASSAAFRRLIDVAIERGGSYFLTYHRWATHEQIAACYPRFTEFLRLKRHHDPDQIFQSEWYRHHARLFADEL
jgi:FAD/FMN-containing dehydrogenase